MKFVELSGVSENERVIINIERIDGMFNAVENNKPITRIYVGGSENSFFTFESIDEVLRKIEEVQNEEV